MSTEICTTCGDFVDESESYFGDDGIQCPKCYFDADTKKMWNKGVVGQALAPVGLGVVGLCFNPLFILSVMTFVAVGNSVRIAMASRNNPEDLDVSSGQRVFLVIGAVVGGLLGLFRLGIDILQLVGMVLS